MIGQTRFLFFDCDNDEKYVHDNHSDNDKNHASNIHIMATNGSGV